MVTPRKEGSKSVPNGPRRVVECHELVLLGPDGRRRAWLGVTEDGATELRLLSPRSELAPSVSISAEADGSGYVCLDYVPAAPDIMPAQRVALHTGPQTGRITVVDGRCNPVFQVPEGQEALVEQLRERLSAVAVEVLAEAERRGIAPDDLHSACNEATEDLPDDVRRALETTHAAPGIVS